MLFMVIEKFKEGGPLPVYRRFRDQGRLAPAELRYISSWVTRDFCTCYQLMKCEERRPLEKWMARWEDLVDFQVEPLMTSAEAFETLEPRL